MLQEHLVHFDLQLIGLKIHRPHQLGGLAPAEAAPADTVMDGAPGVQLQRIGLADLVQGGRPDCAGNLLQTGEPLLLQAPDEGFVIPAQVGHHDHVAAGDIAAHVAVALHEDDVPCAGPGCRDGRGVSGSAAAHHQNVALVVNGNFGALLQIGQFLLAHRLSFLLLRPGISRKCRDDFG